VCVCVGVPETGIVKLAQVRIYLKVFAGANFFGSTTVSAASTSSGGSAKAASTHTDSTQVSENSRAAGSTVTLSTLGAGVAKFIIIFSLLWLLFVLLVASYLE
jgi:hypothetical protein